MTASTPRPLIGSPIIGIALEPFGWHPAAFAEVGADPQVATSADHWIGLVRSAGEAADFVTFEDSFTLTARDRLSGRFDAVLLAARVAPKVPGVGLVPMVTATYTEPFNASQAVATLDHVSDGRAGVQPTTAPRSDGELGARKPLQGSLSQEAELLEYILEIRAWWESWGDAAVIEDAQSRRHIGYERAGRIDVDGEYSSVAGPSITPCPPQGQPVVVMSVADDESAEVARAADVALVEYEGGPAVQERIATLRAAGVARVLVDLTVFLAESERTAVRRLDKLDLREPRGLGAVFAGTGAELAQRVEVLRSWGADGVRLRPGVNSVDIPRLRGAFLPHLSARRRGATLRATLGLGPAANRYTNARGA